MNKKILSISVAAYNIEKYIAQNLDSFINSKMKDYVEVIVTDDGSSDNTTAIVEKYQKKYPDTIKLIKQKNAGPGSTVNSGISNASGKYFRMVDGDDWVETKNLDDLINKLISIDCDMIIMNYEIYDESKQIITKEIKPNIKISDLVLPFDEICDGIELNMHNVIFKTSILKENEIKLDNGFYTDVEYLLLPVKFIDNVMYINKSLYVYRIAREGQSVSLPSLQRNLKQHHAVLERLIKFYEFNKDDMSIIKRNYLITRISSIADSELTTLLSFNMNKENIKKVKSFISYIENESNDIFIKFRTGKKVKFLILTKYKFIKILSYKVKKSFFS